MTLLLRRVLASRLAPLPYPSDPPASRPPACRYAIDGCATFFKRDRFALVKKYEVRPCCYHRPHCASAPCSFIYFPCGPSALRPSAAADPAPLVVLPSPNSPVWVFT